MRRLYALLLVLALLGSLAIAQGPPSVSGGFRATLDLDLVGEVTYRYPLVEFAGVELAGLTTGRATYVDDTFEVGAIAGVAVAWYADAQTAFDLSFRWRAVYSGVVRLEPEVAFTFVHVLGRPPPPVEDVEPEPDSTQ